MDGQSGVAAKNAKDASKMALCLCDCRGHEFA
jgi:hypothetical protein